MQATPANDRLTRHLLIAFCLALALYIVGYWLIEHGRVRHTPWTVNFAAETNSHSLRLTITQASQRLGPVQVRLAWPPDAPLPAATEQTFAEVRPVPFPVPGGQCIFHDATFMPGTVVMEIAGTPIQLLARSLTVGTNEYPWSQTNVIEVPLPLQKREQP
jgi:hypothetical protein